MCIICMDMRFIKEDIKCWTCISILHLPSHSHYRLDYRSWNIPPPSDGNISANNESKSGQLTLVDSDLSSFQFIKPMTQPGAAWRRHIPTKICSVSQRLGSTVRHVTFDSGSRSHCHQDQGCLWLETVHIEKWGLWPGANLIRSRLILVCS